MQSRGASWLRAGLPGRNVPRELQRAGRLPGGGGIGLCGCGVKCQRWWAPPEVCANSLAAPHLGRELSAALQVERPPGGRGGGELAVGGGGLAQPCWWAVCLPVPWGWWVTGLLLGSPPGSLHIIKRER